MVGENNSDFQINISVHWFYKLLYSFGILFFIGMAIDVYFDTKIAGISICYSSFALFQVLGLALSFSTIRINSMSIITKAPHGIHKINWDEVNSIETDGIIFAFFGNGKRFPIHLGMASKEKFEFTNFLEQLVIQRQIDVKPLSSRWLTHKNTKVSRFEI